MQSQPAALARTGVIYVANALGSDEARDIKVPARIRVRGDFTRSRSEFR